MASVILVVGFMGMIQAITIGSEMLATARRQTLASQILEHEIGKLRLTAWSSLPTVGTATTSVDSHFNDAITSCGLTASSITLSRTTADVTTDLKEISFTITWTVTPSSAAASRTYTRRVTAFFGKYGLNNTIQRS